MVNIMASNVILFLLTVLSACFSGHVTLVLALGGALMITVTAGSITDGGGKLLRIAQLFLAVLFALCTGSWWGCLVFAALLWPKAWQTVLSVDLTWTLMFLLTLTGLAGTFGAGGAFGMNAQANLTQKGHELGYQFAWWFAVLGILSCISALIALFRHLSWMSERRAGEEKEKLLKFQLSEMHEIQKNKELKKQSFYVDKNARLTERENISRNIHNSVGHSITAAIMTLDAADALFDQKPEEAHKRMNDATDRIRGSLGAIRSAVRALDEEEQETSIGDLICYFDHILDEFLMDTERTCDRFYEVSAEEYMLPREHAEFLTGALSELLTNGVKHGNAMHFVVKLTGDKAHVRLEVRDNGTSDYSEANAKERIGNGFGLKKLASYAERCGGSTAFFADGGFHSVIELPI